MKKPPSLLLAALIACGLPAMGFAQVSPPGIEPTEIETPGTSDEQTPQRRTAEYRATNASSDHHQELVNYLAAKLMLANECQVEMATMAVEKTSNPKLKQFAETLKQDHQQLNRELQQALPGLEQVESASFAPTAGQANNLGDPLRSNPREPASIPGQRSNVDRPNADRQSDNSTSENAARTRDRRQDFLDGGAQTLIDITRRAAEQNHQMVIEELNQKQGKEFDQCFVFGQIGAHMWMLAELKAIRDVGPQQFTSVVQQAEQKVANHLETAKQLAEMLDSDRGSSAGRSTASERSTETAPRANF